MKFKSKNTEMDINVVNKTLFLQETKIEIAGNSALIFISLYCTFCNDLLPHLKNISEKYDLKVILFTDGNVEENNEMIDYFEWQFSVFTISQDEMIEYFKIKNLPYVLVINQNNQVVSHGNIYDEKMFNLIYKNREI